MSEPAIALFTYNRPQKTDIVLSHLKRQGIGRIYIFCDGPKDKKDINLISQNHSIIYNFEHFDKHITISSTNLGLANSLIKGISNVLQKENSVIVLEDDCVPLPNMINFCKSNLEHWQSDKDIFSISAYHFITDWNLLSNFEYDVFLSQRFLCWGWATWKDRWNHILAQLEKKKNPYHSFRDIPETAGPDLPFHAFNLEKGLTDTWAVPLALICLKNGYRHVMPRYPLVQNIGMDGSGTNCGSNSDSNKPRFWPNYPSELSICPSNYYNYSIINFFNNSMMTPPDWFEQLKKGEKNNEN